MRDLSVRGVTRRHAGSFVLSAILLEGGLSLRKHIVGGNGSVRSRLETWARKEISFDVSECIYGWTAVYEQTWTHVVVRINLVPDAWITAATVETLQRTWETAIEARWSDVWGAWDRGLLTCPFTFDVQWVNRASHQQVRVRSGAHRSDMTTWDTMDGGSTASHEFGHMLGNPDEYTDPECPDRSPVNTGTIMDDNSNNIPSRLLRRLADDIGAHIVSLDSPTTT